MSSLNLFCKTTCRWTSRTFMYFAQHFLHHHLGDVLPLLVVLCVPYRLKEKHYPATTTVAGGNAAGVTMAVAGGRPCHNHTNHMPPPRGRRFLRSADGGSRLDADRNWRAARGTCHQPAKKGFSSDWGEGSRRDWEMGYAPVRGGRFRHNQETPTNYDPQLYMGDAWSGDRWSQAV